MNRGRPREGEEVRGKKGQTELSKFKSRHFAIHGKWTSVIRVQVPLATQIKTTKLNGNFFATSPLRPSLKGSDLHPSLCLRYEYITPFVKGKCLRALFPPFCTTQHSLCSFLFLWYPNRDNISKIFQSCWISPFVQFTFDNPHSKRTESYWKKNQERIQQDGINWRAESEGRVG